ncbi:MAG: hypothetical protein JNM99_13190 [Verrucomicrobiaceae bacterium]|nr:hypothetical protein [Verrucomicrobiaceae bacterium]
MNRNFSHRITFQSTLVLFSIMLVSVGMLRGESPAIVLRDLPLLFADDSGVASSSGVKRTVHPARTRSQAVLEGDVPQEGSRVYLHGSVHYDEATGLLRMWYAGHPDLPDGKKAKVEGFRSGKGNFVLYATSKDGLEWERPTLGLHEFQGSKENNIIYDFHSPSVLVDALDPDPARRYKMLGSLRGAYYSATSADGLHWSGPKEPIVNSSDNITLTRDPTSGDYLAFLRPKQAMIRGYPRRVVALSRSRDFVKWSKPEVVFAPDEQDDTWATEPGQRTEVNNMSVFPHAAGFLSFPTIFRVTAADRPASQLSPGQSATDGTLDVQLITSADGRHWQRTEKREPIIARGAPGSFDAGSIFSVGSTMVHVRDETWVYYTGLSTSHGAPMPPKRIAIGRAEWRRHGFVSLDAGEETGRVETKPLRLVAPRLVINADASGGEARVALREADGREIAGFSIQECTALHADDLRWTPTWKNHASLPIDRPIRVLIELKSARLFSLSSLQQ